MKIRIYILAAILIFSLPTQGMSHSGGTDIKGGHYNRKTGEYHYYNSGRSYNSSPHRPSIYDGSPQIERYTGNPEVAGILEIIEQRNRVEDKFPEVLILNISRTYHRKFCEFAKLGAREARLIKAVRENYRPCSKCNPQTLNDFPLLASAWDSLSARLPTKSNLSTIVTTSKKTLLALLDSLSQRLQRVRLVLLLVRKLVNISSRRTEMSVR
ncbi:MAG: YHYH domain-containing protein [Pelovirga sp.]